MTDAVMTVYFDGHCPLCVREIRWLRKRNTEGRISFEDYNHPGCDAEARFGLKREDLHRAMHGVLPSGEVLRGMAAFRVIYKTLGLGWVLSWTGLPIIRWVFDGLYWCFARIRPIFGRLSGECKDDQCSI